MAANVLEHGTGALNVDGCRVAAADGYTENVVTQGISTARTSYDPRQQPSTFTPSAAGRWPANLIHDGSDEVTALFPETAPAKAAHRGTGKGESNAYGVYGGESTVRGHDDAGGSAARFFYTAKATRAERQGVTHPTVKPLDLMAYLCRLVTPPGGIVLDPFMGSGTTIKAALSEGFNAIGIERDADYFAMAEHRMNGAQLGLTLEATA